MSLLADHAAKLLSPAVGLSVEAVSQLLETPPKGIAADLAFPCFSLAKQFKKSPAAIAQELAAKLKPTGVVARFETAGPYVNVIADWAALGTALLTEILKKKDAYASLPKKRKILIEFAHPNTHKAYHIGHVRNISLGAALARLLEHRGCAVVRANYQGDIGPHVAKCLWGLLHLGVSAPKTNKGLWLGDIYARASKAIANDPAKDAEVREINKKTYARDPAIEKLWKETRQWSLEYFETVYADFGVKFDRYFFESEVEGPAIKKAHELEKKGVALLSDGAIIMDLKKWNLGVYVLLTRDQTPLYSIKDVVLAEWQEKEFHPEQIIHVVGTEQLMHFQQLFKTLEFTAPAIAKKELHLPYELVHLASGKMSSREGNIVTYDQLRAEVYEHALEEAQKHSPQDAKKTAELVTRGAIIYDMLKQSPEKIITFDWKEALRFDGNAAPYLMYTHARASGILEKAGRLPKGDAKHLVHDKEIVLFRKLLAHEHALEAAARDLRPHYLATYAYELATAFNEFYQNCPVLTAETAVKNARLHLVAAAVQVLRNCLCILGIPAPEQM